MAAYRRSLYALDNSAKSKHWSVPDALVATARAWRTYERNDFLSVAAQAMFFTARRRFEFEGARCANASEFGQWFASDVAVESACEKLGRKRWSQVRESSMRQAPRRDAWEDDLHESSLRDAIFSRFRDANDPEEAAAIYEAAARLLILVSGREEASLDPYLDCPLPPNYDMDYPITLRSLQRHAMDTWPQLGTREVLTWIVTEWGLKTHLLVALRKLHHSSKSTFKILPTDRGLELQGGDVYPALTMPRLVQALQIVEDLDLAQVAGETGMRLSAEGNRVLEHGLTH